jgi:macrolide-specific efflux system membrane fusion protein
MISKLFGWLRILMFIVATPGCDFARQNIEKLKAKIDSKTETDPKSETSNSSTAQMVEAKLGNIIDQAEMRGKFEASEKAEIRSDKRIRIGPALAKRYSQIKRGQILFEVDTKELVQKRLEAKERLEQLNIDSKSAHSQLQFAKKNHTRKSKLAEKGIVPQRELDEVSKQLEDAANQVKTKELEIRKATREFEQASKLVTGSSFVSPMDGVVHSIHSGAADINPGDTIATIVDPTKLAIYVKTDEKTASRMSKGFKLTVLPDSAPKEKLIGEVKTISHLPGTGDTVNQYEVQIQMLDADIQRLKLMSGFDANVRAEFARRNKVTTIPIAAIRMNGSDTFSAVSNSLASSGSLKSIKIGLRTKLEAEVVSGVKPGQFVDISPRDEKSP